MPIETQHLAGGYDTKPVVRDINLALRTGEWLSLVGANGSGKSTFLKLLCRILNPTGGIVLLDGKAVRDLPPNVVAQKMAILPQQPTIPVGLSVYQLVSLGRTPHQPWWRWELDAQDRQKVDEAIAQTRLEDYRDRPVTHLSGGERQRAFLALALAQDPKVLLLDEPTTYLDINYQLQLLELLKRLNEEQKLTIITVLHDINLAARYSDRLALLKGGSLYTVGKPAEVLIPETIAQVFGVRVAVIKTPVGLQICPLAPVGS
ncbi:MAG: ABC transporter ATP-binding protein [Hydrococcus sp. C42_A2020_068]|uniref:ABC transporter ATP-binding protein n=1 Tax=Pleurocapsa sp. PCC 7327 TaxID=118163 RepID=UPI00029FC0FB|nr:ABC transporter ATP-binding protein [Pleurocapsa sp. PCC 7327]AFY76201.1 ABC-type cobalamin/Fe3+-siderophore transport system, ATPase component [Pleurocapsa sp. PCC 7327]MBF2018987.1 ABC transporter ATP-binding protein [Hydrococcus sp. C42_A2020_068]